MRAAAAAKDGRPQAEVYSLDWPRLLPEGPPPLGAHGPCSPAQRERQEGQLRELRAQHCRLLKPPPPPPPDAAAAAAAEAAAAAADLAAAEAAVGEGVAGDLRAYRDWSVWAGTQLQLQKGDAGAARELAEFRAGLADARAASEEEERRRRQRQREADAAQDAAERAAEHRAEVLAEWDAEWAEHVDREQRQELAERRRHERREELAEDESLARLRVEEEEEGALLLACAAHTDAAEERARAELWLDEWIRTYDQKWEGDREAAATAAERELRRAARQRAEDEEEQAALQARAKGVVARSAERGYALPPPHVPGCQR